MTNSSARVDIKGRPMLPVDLLVCDNMAFACVDVALQVGNHQGLQGTAGTFRSKVRPTLASLYS